MLRLTEGGRGQLNAPVSAFCQRGREAVKEKKDRETVSSDSPASASSQTTATYWGGRWMDASKVNSHNLQVNTVTYYTHA